MSILLGIDFGTSIAKGTAIRRSGEVLYQVKKELRHDARKGHALSSWELLLEIVRELRGATTGAIECVAITAMVPNVILIEEKNGARFGEELMFYDRRAFDIEQRLDGLLKSKPWANEVLSKLIWIQQRSKRWPRTRLLFFSTHSYLVWRATGAYCIDPVTASECGSLFDSKTGDWNRATIENFELHNIVWPQISPACAIVGHPVDRLLQRLIGCDASIVTGTSDSISTCIGSGLRSRGDILVYYGTFNSATNLLTDMDRCLSKTLHKAPFDWWCSAPRSGQQLHAIANLLFSGRSTVTTLRQFDKAAADSVPGARGLIFLHNEDISRTTVSTKPEAVIRELRIDHTRGDIARAVMESFAYLLKWSADKAGIRLRHHSAYCAGGGAASTIWRQIVSDVTGLRQFYHPEGDRGLGSAMLALRALSQKQFDVVFLKKKKNALVTSPNLKLSKIYERAYKRYVSSWRQ